MEDCSQGSMVDWKSAVNIRTSLNTALDLHLVGGSFRFSPQMREHALIMEDWLSAPFCGKAFRAPGAGIIDSLEQTEHFRRHLTAASGAAGHVCASCNEFSCKD